MENRKNTFGQVRTIPKKAEETRRISFVLSTWTKDRHGTVLNQDNWLLDNYRKNPVVAYQHNVNGGLFVPPDPDFIIGKSVKIDCEGYGKDRKLVSEAEFEDGSTNPLAEKIYRKVLFGSLKAVSVGFLPIGEGHYGEGSEKRGGPNETFYFEGQELLEWSVVNIPSNSDAGKRLLPIGKLMSEDSAPLMYASRKLGMSISRLETMTPEMILDLLEAGDMEIKTTDPEKARKILEEVRTTPKPEEPKKYFVPGENQTNSNIIIKKEMKKEPSLFQVVDCLVNGRKIPIDHMSIIAKAEDEVANIDPTFRLNHVGKEVFAWPTSLRSAIGFDDNGVIETSTAFPSDARGPKTILDIIRPTMLTSPNSATLRVPVSSKFVQDLKAEITGEAEDGAPSVSYADLKANCLTGFIDISRQANVQGGPQMQDYAIGQMNLAGKRKIAQQTFSASARSATAWQGMGYKITTGADTKASAVVPGKANVLDLQKQVADAECFHGNLCYLTSPKGARILMQTPREAGLDKYLMENGQMFGFPVFIDETVSDVAGADEDGSLLIFGDFSSLGVCAFGAQLITVDKYTVARFGKVRLTFHSWWDVKGLQGSYKTDEAPATTDADEYAYAFASMAIKALS